MHQARLENRNMGFSVHMYIFSSVNDEKQRDSFIIILDISEDIPVNLKTYLCMNIFLDNTHWLYICCSQMMKIESIWDSHQVLRIS